MLNPSFKKQFKKDLKLAVKRGNDPQKIKDVMDDLINEEPLHESLRDHQLRGNYVDCRECHIEPDWLLVYMIQGDSIIFIRTGSHSDLFK